MELNGLPPIVGPRSKIIILGSFPGEESLKKQEYYAHPRNIFWNIMGCIVGAGRDKDYSTRVALLQNHGICLWDVYRTCLRDGSLDARIRNGQVNDFNSFLSKHKVKAIFFNGNKSAEAFHRKVVPGLKLSVTCHTLPSTSPANTRISLEEKSERWRLIEKYLQGDKHCEPISKEFGNKTNGSKMCD